MAFAQWLISMLAPAISGLLGVFIGAWLTDRRERREHKLRAYGELLKVLAEAYEAIRILRIVASDTSMTELQTEKMSRAMEIQLRVHQASAVALITVGHEAEVALAAFELDWNAAAGNTTAETARLRMEAIDKVQAALLTVAKRELKT